MQNIPSKQLEEFVTELQQALKELLKETATQYEDKQSCKEALHGCANAKRLHTRPRKLLGALFVKTSEALAPVLPLLDDLSEFCASANKSTQLHYEQCWRMLICIDALTHTHGHNIGFAEMHAIEKNPSLTHPLIRDMKGPLERMQKRLEKMAGGLTSIDAETANAVQVSVSKLFNQLQHMQKNLSTYHQSLMNKETVDALTLKQQTMHLLCNQLSAFAPRELKETKTLLKRKAAAGEIRTAFQAFAEEAVGAAQILLPHATPQEQKILLEKFGEVLKPVKKTGSMAVLRSDLLAAAKEMQKSEQLLVASKFLKRVAKNDFPEEMLQMMRIALFSTRRNVSDEQQPLLEQLHMLHQRLREEVEKSR